VAQAGTLHLHRFHALARLAHVFLLVALVALMTSHQRHFDLSAAFFSVITAFVVRKIGGTTISGLLF